MPDQSSKTTPIDATVFDGAPSFPWIGLVSAIVFISGLALLANNQLLGIDISMAGFAAWMLQLLLPRRRPISTRVFCNVGNIRVAGGETIHAREIVGATTARSSHGVSLALARRWRKAPVILDIASDAALLAICKSLGIGHHGFGEIVATAKPRGIGALRAIGQAGALLACIGGILTPNPFAPLAFLAMIGVGLLWAVAFVMPPAFIRMTSHGVFVPTITGKAFAPFNAITSLELTRNELVMEVSALDGTPITWRAPIETSSWARGAMNRTELERVVEQVRAAVDRANGRYVIKDESENAIATLKRNAGESLRAWFARIDTLGTSHAGGYRAMTIDESALWTLLEDPEAQPDTRAGAARLLARVAPEELKVRVANVLATERSKSARLRISASLDEETLDEEERAEQRATR